MSTPSLLNIPYVIKAGTLYSQIPETGAGDFAVSRTTSPTTNRSTRVNSLGFIELVNDGVPRLDYPLGGAVNGCASLLVEPSAQNLAFHSETWASGNNWTLDAVTRVTGSTSAFLAPDGTFTANALSPTSANVFHGLYSNSSTQNTYISGTIYTQSAFFKQGTGVAGRYVQLTYTGGGQFTQNGYANFDLQLGTVAVVSGTSADTNRAARIENYGNGWYRCSFTATCNAAGNGIGVLPVLVNASGNTRAQSFAGVTGDILYGWGAQLEVGSVATSYIPTTTQAITRGLDSVVKTGITSLIGQSEGTIYLELELRNSTAAMLLFLDVGGSSQYIRITKQATTNAFSVLVLNTSGSTTLFTSSSNPVGIYKLALAYKSGDNAMSINGATPLTSANTSNYPTSSLSRIVLSESVVGLNPLNDRIRAVAIYPNRLTNAQLQVLTTP